VIDHTTLKDTNGQCSWYRSNLQVVDATSMRARKEYRDTTSDSEVVVFVDHFPAAQPFQDDAPLFRARTDVPLLNLRL
jgi:hypothetical protein